MHIYMILVASYYCDELFSEHKRRFWSFAISASLSCVAPPPILIRRGSFKRLKHRKEFRNALRKPRFIKQYVIGLQQLDE